MASSRVARALVLPAASFAVVACSASAESPTVHRGGSAQPADKATGIASSALTPADDDLPDPPPTKTCDGSDGPAYSRYKSLFFGDLHLHTQNSLDAFSAGTRATPADAYLFAKKRLWIQIGTGTTAPPGPAIAIDRPLDFLAVTDHSEWLGIVAGCNDINLVNGTYYDTLQCANVRSLNPTMQNAIFAYYRRELWNYFCDVTSAYAPECAKEVQLGAWEETKTAATNANDPCSFTSLVAYEWTAEGPNYTHWHRNVVFGTDSVPAAPLDSYTYVTTSDLWGGLEDQCKQSEGCFALTIPHNTNMSEGWSIGANVMPSDAQHATWMRKYQRLVEVYQHKGASECFVDPNGGSDPDCDFEYRRQNVLIGDIPRDDVNSYVRSALEAGLQAALTQPSWGNPFAFGMVGATDDHNGTPGHVQESDQTGHAGRFDDSPTKRMQLGTFARYEGSGGLTGVWAEQNTRDRIYAALKRRETFATSGPRISVRFFATTTTPACTSAFPRNVIDAGAIPMGDVVRGSSLSGAPHFAIAAWPDPQPQVLADGTWSKARFAKLQVIKADAAIDGAGNVTLVERRPYDLPINANGGCVEWTDPSFDRTKLSFYYVRVLQVPTRRWSQADCAAAPLVNPAGCGPLGNLNKPEQERAWTSPIWYEP